MQKEPIQPLLKKQDTTLITRLNSENESVELYYVNLSSGITPELYAVIKEKSSRPLKRLSFSASLRNASPAAIEQIATLIEASTAVDVIALNSNDLHKISSQSFCLLLKAFENPALKKIELKDNNLNQLITDNQSDFQNFLQNTSATILDLETNNISDQVATLLALHGRFMNINLQQNPVTDPGSQAFLMNNYLLQINLPEKTVSKKILTQLETHLRRNQDDFLGGRAHYVRSQQLQCQREDAFVNAIYPLVQGLRQEDNVFASLPPDMVRKIFHCVGEDIRTPTAINALCDLIITNICGNELKKLEWKQEKIFKTRALPSKFFKSHHYVKGEFADPKDAIEQPFPSKR
ncbi:MAG: hypothetical protein H0U71_08155 [Gammaproteobacteria bacterium]|nr:hypothetical protein [Gammaproteobacteria bacterium]